MTKRLRDLPVGAKVKDLGTSFGGRTLIWQLVDKNHKGYPDNTATLISDKVLSNKKFDTSSKLYKTSDIRKWLNDEKGLMIGFSPEFKSSIVNTDISTASSGIMTDKMFFASGAELGLEAESSKEGYKFALFTSNESRKASNFSNYVTEWWTRTDFGAYYVYFVRTYGDWNYDEYKREWGVRPLCNIKNTVLVKDEQLYDTRMKVLEVFGENNG